MIMADIVNRMLFLNRPSANKQRLYSRHLLIIFDHLCQAREVRECEAPVCGDVQTNVNKNKLTEMRIMV